MCNAKEAEADNAQEQRIKLHDAYRQELLKRQLSNTENYDRTIITLSSAGLAISLTAINFVVSVGEAKFLWMLVVCWFAFLTSIITGLLAYWIGNKALDKQMDIAEDYYLKNNEDAQTQKNTWSSWNAYLNNTAGISLAVAFITLTLFVALNVTGKTNMPKNQPINNISKVAEADITKSAVIPRMQTIPDVVATQKPKVNTDTPEQKQPNKESK